MKEIIGQIFNGFPRNAFTLYTTGGGIQSLSWLLTVPGASRSILNAGVPYSRAALNDILGTVPTKSCSSQTTQQLALEAFRNSASIVLQESLNFDSLSNSNIFGIACSAALISSSPRKGTHRCHVSSVSCVSSKTWSLELSKGLRTREEEDYVCSRMILDAICLTSNVSSLPVDYLKNTEQQSQQFQQSQQPQEVIVQNQLCRMDNLIDQLLQNEVGMILFVKKPSSEVNSISTLSDDFNLYDDLTIPPGTIIYPGSFNPFHEGHAHLSKAALHAIVNKNLNEENEKHNQNEIQEAEKITSFDQIPIIFEIAVVNADKPPLSKEEIYSRLQQFSSRGNATRLLHDIGVTNFAVCITSRPLFSTKVNLFPSCKFLLGADTLVRLFDQKYYDNSRDNMILALGRIVDQCQLIVGGRVASQGNFVTAEAVLASLNIPEQVMKKVISLPESSFRCDVSSSALRAKLQDKERDQES